jgi:hypothetical protein
MKIENETKRPDDYFGLCPICDTKRPPNRRDVGRLQYMCCDEHKVRWCIGENILTPQMRDIAEEDGYEAAVSWNEEQKRLLDTYEKVEPFYWPMVCAQCGRNIPPRLGGGSTALGDFCARCTPEFILTNSEF